MEDLALPNTEKTSDAPVLEEDAPVEGVSEVVEPALSAFLARMDEEMGEG